jgi:integrase
MAGRLRYFKEQNGHYYTRIAVPKELQPFIGKTQLQESLGSERKAAERLHHSAVAKFQADISAARRQAAQVGAVSATRSQFPLTVEQIALSHYQHRLSFDEQLRGDERYASVGFDDRHVERLKLGIAGQLADDDLQQLVGLSVRRYQSAGNHDASYGSPEWRQIARALCAAEYEALARAAERDDGDFSGQPAHPLLVNATMPEPALPPVSIETLFADYITSRQALGKHLDGGANWIRVITSLTKFLGHKDARKITKRRLLDWRDHLLNSGLAPRTVADVYLACIRAILAWAHENDRLATNEAALVKQETPKKRQTRERGYTTDEAVALLTASLRHQPPAAKTASTQESKHITAARTWVPLLLAFTGARVVEITQLRQEDVRQDGDRWIIRITPDAGSVKTGEYRDVPLHRQVVELGFTEFVKQAASGPLFHRAKRSDGYLSAARTTAGRVSDWLQKRGLVPEGVQPSHGWRHRFKTLGRELGLSDRVIDAIQGHAGRTAGDGYGDVTLAAKIRVIDALPEYDLGLPGLEPADHQAVG